jgi:hypothetical protein
VTKINHIDTAQGTAAPRLAYVAPESIEVGNAAELVQGGGGMSGLDYAYYYYFDGNGQ